MAKRVSNETIAARNAERDSRPGRWLRRAAARVIVYCARCSRATTKLEAQRRVFFTGFSGCCNDYLLADRPRNACTQATPAEANANESSKSIADFEIVDGIARQR